MHFWIGFFVWYVQFLFVVPKKIWKIKITNILLQNVIYFLLLFHLIFFRPTFGLFQWPNKVRSTNLSQVLFGTKIFNLHQMGLSFFGNTKETSCPIARNLINIFNSSLNWWKVQSFHWHFSKTMCHWSKTVSLVNPMGIILTVTLNVRRTC